MSGGGGQTSSSSNSPPPQYLAAYSDVLAKAQEQQKVPYQPYTGQLQAGFSPMQSAGFDTIASAPGVSAPYLNVAAQDFANANAPLQPQIQPYVDQAQGQFQQEAGANLPGAISPFQQQAQQGFAAGSQSIDPTQYSGQAIQGFYNPYQQSVIDATQAHFNEQNAQAQTSLRGNAASQNALGGDRLGIAQATLAGQQQNSQAPVIAGLENQGFQQAQQEFNQQQQANLGAQQNTAARQLQGAQGMTGLGTQALTAAQQQAALQGQAGTGFAGLGQQELGAAQGQGWLNAQSGAGMAGLGNQALSSTLAAGNAQLSAGAQQQAQAQGSLNIPYQQFLAQQSYPFQSIGWLSNIAQGLGSSSGGTSSSTAPAPSAFSQAAGLGIAGVGLANQLGAFSGLGGSAAGAGAGLATSADLLTAGATFARGGSIGFAGGGSVVPDTAGTPTFADVTQGDNSAPPDLRTSYVPAYAQGQHRGFGIPKPSPAPRPEDYGADAQKLTSEAKDVGLFKKSTNTQGFAGGGGVPDVSVDGVPMGVLPGGQPGSQDILIDGSGIPDAGGSPVPAGAPMAGVPTLKRDYGTTTHTSGGDSIFGTLLKTAGQIAAGVYGGPAGAAAAGALSSQVHFDRGGAARGFGHGGSVPVLPRGFAAGGSPAISVSTVPNARGFGVPTMTVDPSVVGGSSGAATGSASQQLSDYLAATKAGAHQVTPPPAPAAPAAPTPDPQTSAQNAFIKAMMDQQAWQQAQASPMLSGDGGQMRRGGMIRGFAQGGDTDADPDLDFNPSRYLPQRDGPDAPVAQDAPTDDAPLSVPPIPPGQSGGFARPTAKPTAAHDYGSNPLLGGLTPDDTASPPVTQGFGGGPPPSPNRPIDRDPASGFYADQLARSRALQEDHASPGMALMKAGFAMMAGTSHNAGTNIGAGALAGVNEYVSADRAAKDLAAKVDETRARLAESQAYHEAASASRNYGIDTRHQDRQDAMANQQVIAFARMAAAAERSANAGQAGRYSFVGVDGDGNSILLDAKSGETKTGPKIGMKPKDQAASDLGSRRADQADTRIEETAAWHNKEAELRDQGFTESARRNILNNAANLVRADLTGKTTFDNAVQLVRKQAGNLGGNRAGATALPLAQTDTPDANALPEGTVVTQGGVQYRRQSGAWVPN